MTQPNDRAARVQELRTKLATTRAQRAEAVEQRDTFQQQIELFDRQIDQLCGAIFEHDHLDKTTAAPIPMNRQQRRRRDRAKHQPGPARGFHVAPPNDVPLIDVEELQKA